jgi:type II secretory pathway component PulF
MANERDICERLEDQSIDGAIFLRLNAAKEIRALRHYVAQLEHDLVEEEHQHAKTKIQLENAQEHSSDQALDIVMLGQEVGRLREALERIANTAEDAAVWWLQDLARAALAEKEK